MPRRCIGASNHDSLSWDLDWRHRRRTFGTIAPRRVATTTNSSVVGFYPCFIRPNVPSGRTPVQLRQELIHFALGDDYLGRILFPVGRLPVAHLHAVTECDGFPLGPIALVDMPRIVISPHWGRRPASLSLIRGPRSLSDSCSLLRSRLVPAVSSGRDNHPHTWFTRK
jgi:hypothetical protein